VVKGWNNVCAGSGGPTINKMETTQTKEAPLAIDQPLEALWTNDGPIGNPKVISVRYIVVDVDECVKFYTELLGFEVVLAPPASGFAMLSKGNLRILLNEPGAGGAGQSMPDGTVPTPGGWSRFQLEVDDIESVIKDLRNKNARFRNDLVTAKAGKQILLMDPAGNLIELFEPSHAKA